MDNVILQVSDFLALTNQTLEFAYPSVVIEGEVSQYKISKNKWVFFDLKDAEGTVNCFMSIYQLRSALEDGMRIRVTASPKVTNWGRFSLTVRSFEIAGEGDLKRSFELLKAKLQSEGLFEESRKRPLPRTPQKVGVISSGGAAGYADFLKILDSRWQGLDIQFADVQVQGAVAPDQIVNAITYFNEVKEPVDVLVLLRGGGSADDLQAFNTEPVARAVAGSRTPIIVGVGHETDTTLADLAADVRAATPSNAAELIVPDRAELVAYINSLERSIPERFHARLGAMTHRLESSVQSMASALLQPQHRLALLTQQLHSYNPRTVLNKGYGLVRMESGAVVKSGNEVMKGDHLVLELSNANVEATVDGITKKDR